MTFNPDRLPRGGRVFIHPCCSCGAADAPFGYGCNPRADRGRWFCSPCREGKEAAGVNLDKWMPDGWPFRDDESRPPEMVIDAGGQGRLL